MSFEVVKSIRRFADEDSETIGRDVLRRELHNFADKVDETIDAVVVHYNRRIAMQAKVMAETADRNVKQKKINKELVDENAALRAKLKVAEDALENTLDFIRQSCHELKDGMLKPCKQCLGLENALAAIREEGGAK